MSNYELNIISYHSDFKNKTLKKYHVEGIDTIGSYGNEPFGISFKNNTGQKVQVKISLDGTDILTGELADTNVSDNMWVVKPYDTLLLKAWPETNAGGAAFTFTSAEKSVAYNLHKDLSHQGIIAAAVYVEGHFDSVSPIYYPIYQYFNVQPVQTYPKLWEYNTTTLTVADNYTYSNATSHTNTLESPIPCSAVGAGQYTEQNITNVAGLVKPVFSEAIRVRHIWWDDLVSKLRVDTQAKPHPSGFPGNIEHNNINLKNTPRINQDISSRVNKLEYSRV